MYLEFYISIRKAVYFAVFVSLFINGLFILLEKFELLDWLRMRATNNFISKMLDCYFCLAHHVTILVTIPVMIIDFNVTYLAVPLMVAGSINLMK